MCMSVEWVNPSLYRVCPAPKNIPIESMCTGTCLYSVHTLLAHMHRTNLKTSDMEDTARATECVVVWVLLCTGTCLYSVHTLLAHMRRANWHGPQHRVWSTFLHTCMPVEGCN